MKRLGIAVALILMLHLTLLWALGGADFMGALAAARHGHVALVAAFTLLMMVRLAAILLVPGLLFASIIRIFDSFRRSNNE
jgi:hypothetical protein